MGPLAAISRSRSLLSLIAPRRGWQVPALITVFEPTGTAGGVEAQLGRLKEAEEALEKAIAIPPALFERNVRGRVPWMRPEDHAHMLEGLRKAGWEG
jgi:hypothetical protein